MVVPEVALRVEEQIAVVGILKPENSKQQVPWTEAALLVQIGILPED